MSEEHSGSGSDSSAEGLIAHSQHTPNFFSPQKNVRRRNARKPLPGVGNNGERFFEVHLLGKRDGEEKFSNTGTMYLHFYQQVVVRKLDVFSDTTKPPRWKVYDGTGQICTITLAMLERFRGKLELSPKEFGMKWSMYTRINEPPKSPTHKKTVKVLEVAEDYNTRNYVRGIGRGRPRVDSVEGFIISPQPSSGSLSANSLSRNSSHISSDSGSLSHPPVRMALSDSLVPPPRPPRNRVVAPAAEDGEGQRAQASFTPAPPKAEKTIGVDPTIPPPIPRKTYRPPPLSIGNNQSGNKSEESDRATPPHSNSGHTFSRRPSGFSRNNSLSPPRPGLIHESWQTLGQTPRNGGDVNGQGEKEENGGGSVFFRTLSRFESIGANGPDSVVPPTPTTAPVSATNTSNGMTLHKLPPLLSQLSKYVPVERLLHLFMADQSELDEVRAGLGLEPVETETRQQCVWRIVAVEAKNSGVELPPELQPRLC
eukprot:comp19646_c0_seq1/m.23228 comp19646_c0_seq1/g.23228  ORF comp19646_c0_seq1/g.23228 comp19646_c0_seq1/m.23228 type:complete len:482 (-) comp19646_c0_seq1:1050-2495(-)